MLVASEIPDIPIFSHVQHTSEVGNEWQLILTIEPPANADATVAEEFYYNIAVQRKIPASVWSVVPDVPRVLSYSDNIFILHDAKFDVLNQPGFRVRAVTQPSSIVDGANWNNGIPGRSFLPLSFGRDFGGLSFHGSAKNSVNLEVRNDPFEYATLEGHSFQYSEAGIEKRPYQWIQTNAAKNVSIKIGQCASTRTSSGVNNSCTVYTVGSLLHIVDDGEVADSEGFIVEHKSCKDADTEGLLAGQAYEMISLSEDKTVVEIKGGGSCDGGRLETRTARVYECVGGYLNLHEKTTFILDSVQLSPYVPSYSRAGYIDIGKRAGDKFHAASKSACFDTCAVSHSSKYASYLSSTNSEDNCICATSTLVPEEMVEKNSNIRDNNCVVLSGWCTESITTKPSKRRMKIKVGQHGGKVMDAAIDGCGSPHRCWCKIACPPGMKHVGTDGSSCMAIDPNDDLPRCALGHCDPGENADPRTADGKMIKCEDLEEMMVTLGEHDFGMFPGDLYAANNNARGMLFDGVRAWRFEGILHDISIESLPVAYDTVVGTKTISGNASFAMPAALQHSPVEMFVAACNNDGCSEYTPSGVSTDIFCTASQRKKEDYCVAPSCSKTLNKKCTVCEGDAPITRATVAYLSNTSSSVALEAYHPRASWWDEWCGKCTKFNISVDGGPWFFNKYVWNAGKKIFGCFYLHVLLYCSRSLTMYVVVAHFFFDFAPFFFFFFTQYLG